MAGRVLSKKNESALRAASEQLAAILALLDKESESDSDEAKEARRLLQEAANLGNWLEARIHLAFTEIADNMFGNGQLTREERIGLSAAIGAGLDSFNASVAEALPQIYQRAPWAEAPDMADMAEAAIDAEYMPLVEQAIRRDGTIPAKLIAPGWGSSGYYSPEVLQRDGPKVFTAGTKMFWDHPTAQEEAARPEGSLNALAAELVSDARWADGPSGPGLYADAKVFEGYQGPINDMAKHIGVSIRALGRAVQGEAEGRKGPIIQSITNARSVDFVTEPGAGGKILEMFEAARTTKPVIVQQESDMSKELQETIAQVQADNARLREAMILRDAKDFVREQVARANVPDVTKARLIEQLSANPPVKDGMLDTATFATRIEETVKGEIEYLTKAAGYGSGRIEGMGGNGESASQQVKPDEVQAKMTEAFQTFGLSKSAAEAAAKGRGW